MAEEPPRSKYRSDIDGLRTVAIIAVMVFHSDYNLFPGGQMGVDVFFTISGFVIALTSRQQLIDGTFQPLTFMSKRLQRIMPPLLITVAVTLLAAWRVFLPSYLIELGKSLASSSVFGVNVYYYFTVNYFFFNTRTMPLQHLWTLSVEVQFYVVWAVVASLACKFKLSSKNLKVLLLVLAAMSISANYFSKDTNGIFYLLHFRIWEILTGCFIGLQMSQGEMPSRYAEIVGIFGQILILSSMFLRTVRAVLDLHLVFMVALGTAMCLVAGRNERTLNYKLLSNRIFCFVGERSYSIYLIHNVIFAFHRYLSNNESAGNPLLIYGVPILILAHLSHRWLEKPQRYWTQSSNLARSLLMPLGGAMLMLGAASLLITNGGFPQRFDARIVKLEEQSNYIPVFPRPCCIVWHPNPTLLTRPDCRLRPDLQGDSDSSKQVIVMGDSHAYHLEGAFEYLAERLDFDGRKSSCVGCPPLVDIHLGGIAQAKRETCRAYREAMFNYVLKLDRPSVIVLGALWTSYAEPTETMAAGQMGRMFLALDDAGAEDGSFHAFQVALTSTVRRLTSAGHKVILFGQLPEFDFDPKLATANAWIAGRPTPTVDAVQMRDKLRPVADALSELSKSEKDVFYYEALGQFCSEFACSPVLDDDVLVFRDKTHLSWNGARLLGQKIEADFKKLLDSLDT